MITPRSTPDERLTEPHSGLHRGDFALNVLAMRSRAHYVVREVPGGYRIWDARRRVWWGDRYLRPPNALADELNNGPHPARITLLLAQAKPHLHHQRIVG